MQLLNNKKSSFEIDKTISWIKSKIYLRSDMEDNLRWLIESRDDVRSVIENRVMATDKLKLRIDEANYQNHASLAYDTIAEKGIGKSFFNYTLAFKILETRDVTDWKRRIVFKLDDNIIKSPSEWAEGMKYVANQMSDIEDGPKWAVLQDEKDKEWGKGSRKQEYNQRVAIDNMRKLGIILAFATPFKKISQLEDAVSYDIRFVFLGYDWFNNTGVSMALMFYRRCQGIVAIKSDPEVIEFLEKEYVTDAKEGVWDDAKAGFHKLAIDPDDDENNGVSQVVSGENEAMSKSIENRQFDEFFYDISGDHLLRKGIATEMNPVMYWVLRNLGRFQPRGKSKKLGKWTHSTIAEALDVRESAVQKWLSSNDPKVSDTDLGDCLELAILSWLNQSLQNLDPQKFSRSSHNPSGGVGGDMAVKRSSGPGFCDLFVGECNGENSEEGSHVLSINAKVKTGGRSSYSIDVLPEFEHCPSSAFAAVWTPRFGLKIYKANVGRFSTSSNAIEGGLCEELTLNQLVNEIQSKLSKQSE